MVNVAVVDKEKCTTMYASNSPDGVGFIKSMVKLVEHSIKAYAGDDMSCDLLHLLFATEMH